VPELSEKRPKSRLDSLPRPLSLGQNEGRRREIWSKKLVGGADFRQKLGQRVNHGRNFLAIFGRFWAKKWVRSAENRVPGSAIIYFSGQGLGVGIPLTDPELASRWTLAIQLPTQPNRPKSQI